MMPVSPQAAGQVDWKLSYAALLMSMKERGVRGWKERKEEEKKKI